MKVIRKYINEFTEAEKTQIDTFIELNDGLIFHETKFNEIASETFNSHLSYFLAYIDQKLVGICPVHSVKRGMVINSYSNSGGFEIPYGGWVYDKNEVTFKDLWYNMDIRWNESLTYWSSILSLDFPLMKSRKEYYTGIVNLKLDIENIWFKELKSNLRNKIRRAEKNQIKILVGSIDFIETFYELLGQMNNKTGMRSKQLSYYRNIFNRYSPGNAAIIFATKDGIIISGLFLIGNSNLVHYWQGATINGVEKNLYQNELLHWEAIKWARKQGAKYYDLCVIDPKRLPHIAQFKMGFTKELTSFYYLDKKPLSFKILNKIQNVFNN